MGINKETQKKEYPYQSMYGIFRLIEAGPTESVLVRPTRKSHGVPFFCFIRFVFC